MAPSGFKESLSAEQLIDCTREGARRADSLSIVTGIPIVDGGEGFTKTLVEVTGGQLFAANVTGPVGQSVTANFGFLGGEGPKTAVLEMAAAAGLRLVPRNQRDPSVTTSYGVGELIKAALDAGAERIIMGCGDSGINDGGAGMAQALGVGLLDKDGNAIPRGGQGLHQLDRIDLSARDPRLADTPFEVAVNWFNVLLGKRGVARVFGPQKGATPEMVDQLEKALENYAAIIERDLDLKVATMAGSGASGGLGTGLHALLGATLRPRYEIVMRYLEVDGQLENCDLVITAEGSIDAQTPRGKAPAEIARRAKRLGLPVIALVGTVGSMAAVNHEHGIDAFFSIAKGPCTLEQCLQNAQELVTELAEQAIRCVTVGMTVQQRQIEKSNIADADLSPPVAVSDEVLQLSSHIDTLQDRPESRGIELSPIRPPARSTA